MGRWDSRAEKVGLPQTDELGLELQVEIAAARLDQLPPWELRVPSLEHLDEQVDPSNGLGRNAGDDVAVLDVAGHDRIRRDDRVRADGDARQDHGAPRDEDVVANRDRTDVVELETSSPIDHVDRAVVTQNGADRHAHMVAEAQIGGGRALRLAAREVPVRSRRNISATPVSK